MRVLTAPMARAAGDISSTKLITACLWGMVILAPAKPSAVRPATAAASRSGGTAKGTYVQSRPNAPKAALCMAGERLCETGQPTTPATRVRPVIVIVKPQQLHCEDRDGQS